VTEGDNMSTLRPPLCPFVRPSPSVSQFVRCCFCDNFNTIKRYVDETWHVAICRLCTYLFFGSPEHEVLMVSYCGGWLFVVRRRVSFVVRRQCFECKHSREPECDETLSKCLSRHYLGNAFDGSNVWRTLDIERHNNSNWLFGSGELRWSEMIGRFLFLLSTIFWHVFCFPKKTCFIYIKNYIFNTKI